jgi:hypothetical protein
MSRTIEHLSVEDIERLFIPPKPSRFVVLGDTVVPHSLWLDALPTGDEPITWPEEIRF